MKHISRLFLNSSYVSKEEWKNLITTISKYNGFFRSWKIIVEIDQNRINYYLVTNFKVPTNISNSYLIESIDNLTISDYYLTSPTFIPLESNIIDIINYSKIKNRWFKVHNY